MAEIQVLAADGVERKFTLADKAVTLGRTDDCDVVLAESKASRKHCRIEPRAGAWRVVDEGSSNGTWLGGKPVLAARLKSGDEIEIGDTFITFVDGASGPAAPRKPRVRKKPTPWGVLFLPILAVAASYGAKTTFEKSESADASAALVRYAKAEIERSSFQKDVDKRRAALDAARATLEKLKNSADAVAVVDAAARGPAPVDPGDAAAKLKNEWRAALEKFDADKTASPSQRRTTLANLLERHADDAEAATALRDRLRAELTSSGERVRIDRAQTFADADQAVVEGRFGQALSLWTSWIQRVQSISAEDDAEIAKRLADICEKSRAAAQEAADQFDRARQEGRTQAGQSALESAIERLRGTGFDAWLAARGGIGTGKPGAKPGPEKADDPAARERAKALQIKAAGEQMARRRQFSEAATKVDEAAAAVSDAALKKEIAQRAEDLRGEAAFVVKLLGWIAADPKKFSPLKLGDKLYRVSAATAADVSILGGDGAPEAHSVADLPSTAFVQFIEKAAIDKTDFIDAALVANDLGEQDAYVKWMRAALAVDDMRVAASEVHARCTGRANPTGGFMPHPSDPKSIITYDEYRAIINAVKIAALRGDLIKVVERVEKSKQAKQVDAVRKQYAKLEQARSYALELIFDEVKYFYPYRGTGRETEYAKVQREVDERVKAVREAWADKAKENVRTDAALEKGFADADKIVTDIQFYGGDTADLVNRVDNVRMYLGHELTVQTFFENQRDQDLMAYDAKVMKWNQTAKGPTDPERKQVEITNEYRIMFGHRRAVRINANLVTSSRGHSEDMSKGGFFDHFDKINPGKYSPEDRMKLAGYAIAGGSENIYEGSSSPEAAHEGWIHSSGHHRNILTPAWVEMGSGSFGRDWTQNFGFRIDDDWEGGVWK